MAQGLSEPSNAAGTADRQQVAYLAGWCGRLPDARCGHRAILLRASASASGATHGWPVRDDHRNASFWLDERLVTLVDGMAEQPAAPGSAAVERTRIVERPAPVSATIRGQQVTALALADEPGGSGTFYYIAVARNGGSSPHAVFLGDRVLLKSISIEGADVVVRYLDRKTGDAMTTPPSVAVERRFIVRRDRVVEHVATVRREP